MFSNVQIKKSSFISLFVLLGFLAMQVPFSKIIGSEVKFNLFDFYGPIVGGFIGSTVGVVIVFVMQLLNWAWHGFALDTATLIRFLPVLFSVMYFAKKTKWNLLAPAVCMITFWAHPEGRIAWTYALYWLIPIIMYILHDKFIFARALGATFTAHAVGGALWVWAFNMKAEIWLSLIPVVWKERGLMAIGIMLTFVIFNYVLRTIDEKTTIKLPFLKLHPKFSFTTK